MRRSTGDALGSERLMAHAGGFLRRILNFTVDVYGFIVTYSQNESAASNVFQP